MTSASSLSPRLGERAGVEAGHRREVHRREHAVGVHVAHPLVHVEAAGPQLGVRAGVEAPLLLRPADGGGHAERRGGRLALEHPLVDALRRCGRPWAPGPATSPGTWFSYMSGGSIMWSSMLTRIMSSICMAGLLRSICPADGRSTRVMNGRDRTATASCGPLVLRMSGSIVGGPVTPAIPEVRHVSDPP